MKRPWLELVDATAAATGETKAATERVLRQFFEHLAEAVWATGRVGVPGLGAFRVRSRKARRIANPQTGEPMKLPRERAVHCRVAASWRRDRG